MPKTDDPHDGFPNLVRLSKKAPGRNAELFYLIQVQRGLFGWLTLVIEQGRVGGSSRKRRQNYDSEDEARTAMLELMSKIKRRGYVD